MVRFSRAPKYKATRCEYGGESFDSRSEAAYAKRLDGERALGAFLWYLRQPTFKLGCPENVYRPDFLIVYPRFVLAVDVKGFETPKFKKDKKLWAKYGPCPLQVVRLTLAPAKATPPGEVPAIRKVEFDIVPGGRDPRAYGPLHPQWLREVEIPR